MTVRKIVSLVLITSCILLMLHSVLALYIGQCMRSTVSPPSFFTNGMIEFFQLETSAWGKSLRLIIILIFPSLGIELYKNKKDSFLTISLLLRIVGILLIVSIICYILFYPFFE